VVGKPEDAFFTTALAALEVSPSAALMVGDDIEADVLAAQAQRDHRRPGQDRQIPTRDPPQCTPNPDHVLDSSFADLPALVGRSAGDVSAGTSVLRQVGSGGWSVRRPVTKARAGGH
jgi:FMN phosphatase YigB (HAD superfamily)